MTMREIQRAFARFERMLKRTAKERDPALAEVRRLKTQLGKQGRN